MSKTERLYTSQALNRWSRKVCLAARATAPENRLFKSNVLCHTPRSSSLSFPFRLVARI